MLEKLHLKNVGPAPELEIEFAPRVNIITGDNGLGKSFILDVAWWVLTQNWIAEVNPQVQNSKQKDSVTASISSNVLTWGMPFSQKTYADKYEFHPELQEWDLPRLISDHALVLSYRTDGTFAVRDPARYHGQSMYPVLIFSSKSVWDGSEQNGKIISNGLIRDVSKWQLENGAALKQFQAALIALSSNSNESLELGKTTRVSISDARDIPTLEMPYNQAVPIIHASSAIRRIVAFAYMIVWTWQEHLRIGELTGDSQAREIILLIDELEQHLHPQWQRVILESILNVVEAVSKEKVKVQIIATTHSPLVMASLEPLFDEKQDAWFDLNLVKGEVKLEKMKWRKRGGAEAWLTSEAFDLDSTGSLEAAQVMERAAKAFTNPKLSKKKFLELDSELRGVLSDMDEFWIRWRFIGEKKGYL